MSGGRAADRGALELLKQHGIVKPPVPVEDVARNEGIQVVRTQAAEKFLFGVLLRDARYRLRSRANAPPRDRLFLRSIVILFSLYL